MFQNQISLNSAIKQISKFEYITNKNIEKQNHNMKPLLLKVKASRTKLMSLIFKTLKLIQLFGI